MPHAATPAQLCPVAGGLPYYFIGPGGSSRTGPHLAPFSELAALHATGAPGSLYTGANSFTGKPVQIDYLPAEPKIRVSAYYPDTQYDTNKPYVFTVDSGNSVAHEGPGSEGPTTVFYTRGDIVGAGAPGARSLWRTCVVVTRCQQRREWRGVRKERTSIVRMAIS